MYYVYEWFIVETGEVFYVGKGTGRRYKVRKHNQFFNRMLERFDCDSRIIKEFETEKEAFEYEFERVNELKAQGQCVCNIYNGGYGGTTEWWTDSIREKYAVHNTMKSESQRKRMSEHNPMKDADVAERANARKRIPVVIGDKEYASIKAVCEENGVSRSTVIGWIIAGTTSKGERCTYKGNVNAEMYAIKNTGQKHPLIYKGVRYNSSTELSLSIGVSQTTAARWCRQGRDTLGNPCRYLEDTRENTECIKQKHIPVIVNGVLYESKEHASRALGISTYLITQYLKGKKHDAKYICEYGNQQPSQGNVDESTLEGSTTNG
jgi:hypothetical protein